MCGYIVYYNKNEKKSLSKSNINNILKIQKHRGPDFAGFKNEKNILFFHNRLKVIDFSSVANQPFQSQKTGNIIVFNGEIYNYKELKKKYNLNNFQSKSDTEVILKLYENYGLSFVKQLNGIFSFIIYDKNKKTLTVARDRFGVKPLYYYFDKKKIIFSTEIKPILHFVKNYKVNLEKIKHYIASGLLDYNKNTFFKEVYSLDSATLAIFSIKKLKFIYKKKYWKLKKNKKLVCSSYKSFERKFYHYAKKSFQLNLVSDAKIALMLSSGIDSNFIKSFIERKLNFKLKCYTYGWKMKKYDEVAKLKKLKFIDKNCKFLIVDPVKIFSNLKNLIYKFEWPLGGFATAAQHYLMKKIKKKNIKVTLSGEGCDEFMLGYRNLKILHLYDLYKKNRNLFNKELNNSKITREIVGNNRKKFLISAKNFLNEKIYSPDGMNLEDSDLLYIKKKYLNKSKNYKFDDVVLNYAFKSKLPKLLTYFDKASALTGIEGRVPLLDHNLVELVFSNSNNFKFFNGQSKYPLINWLKKNNANFYASKLEVATPQREFFKNKKIFNQVMKLIKYGYLNKLKIINLDKFYNKYKQYLYQDNLGNSFFIWKIVNCELFLKNFLK